MYSYIIFIFGLLFFIEYYFFSNDKKYLLIYVLRYILVNIFICLIFFLFYKKGLYFLLLLSFVKLLVDIFFVFKKLVFKQTDWKKYYSKKPIKIIIKKRNNNICFILNVLKSNSFFGGNVLEYGGGNSMVAEAISNSFDVRKFTIVDSNKYGIELLKNRNIDNLNARCESIFEYKDEKIYDLIYSIGLIEHFQENNLIKCIKEHFRYVKDGGYVLITFPVKCFRYMFIRAVMEVFNLWRYTDEVPLNNKKIGDILKDYGDVIVNEVNSKLILPQAFILVKKGVKLENEK